MAITNNDIVHNNVHSGSKNSLYNTLFRKFFSCKAVLAVMLGARMGDFDVGGCVPCHTLVATDYERRGHRPS